VADPRFQYEASIRDFLAALASPEEGYGAVSASAAAAGMATSLLLLVAALPTTKSESIDDRTALVGAATALGGLREQLMETIETETAVKVFAARNMPQANRTERLERETAIQLALGAAADVPLEVMRLCTLGLKQAETVAAHGCRAASREVELAVALLRVAFNGARSNLETRLSSLTDVVYTKAIVDEIADLSQEAVAAAHGAESLTHSPPA